MIPMDGKLEIGEFTLLDNYISIHIKLVYMSFLARLLLLIPSLTWFLVSCFMIWGFLSGQCFNLARHETGLC
jgi:hypothetical protein